MAKKTTPPSTTQEPALEPAPAETAEAAQQPQPPAPDPATAPEPASAPAAAIAPAPAPAPALDREAELQAKIDAIGDPYAKRQAINASIIAAKEELAEIQREYKASIAKLEDEFRDAEETARWVAEDKRLLELELARVRKEKALQVANQEADAAAKVIRAQVESELARSGVTT